MNYTREKGIIENFLSKKRCNLALRIIKKFDKKDRILDIGCGSYPYFLLKTNFNEKYGIEKVNYNSQNNIKDIKIYNMDLNKICKLPFDNDYFYVITMLAVIEHVEYKISINLLKEINRILKKDGILIITTPEEWANSILILLSKFNIVSREEIDEHINLFNKNKLFQALLDSGFKKDKISIKNFEIFMNILAYAKKE